MMMLIPRYKLYLNWRIFWIILEKMLTCKFLKGGCVKEFEEKFKEYIGVKHAIATPSAKVSLYLLLKAFNLKKGDEVLVTTYTVADVINMITCAGLKPVFVDIDTHTFNTSPKTIEGKITSRTKVILLTHLFGQPCEMDKILTLAKNHNIITIEDCAQSLGAVYNGKKTGSICDAGYFSFGSYKNCTTFYGGMVTTDNEKLAVKIRKSVDDFPYPKRLFLIKRMIRDTFLWFATSSLLFPLVYTSMFFINLYNYNLIDDLLKTKPMRIKKIPTNYLVKYANVQAAVGLEQLKHFDDKNTKRINNAEHYTKGLSELHGLKLPRITDRTKNIFLNYPVMSQEKKILRKKLFNKGIDLTFGNDPVC